MDASAMTLALVIGLAAGTVLGAAHLASLWWSVALLCDGRPILGVMMQALRFVVLAAGLALIVRHGAVPLVAATAGVLAARAVLLRSLEKTA
jgi:F1F0 ATPase subunit 2